MLTSLNDSTPRFGLGLRTLSSLPGFSQQNLLRPARPEWEQILSTLGTEITDCEIGLAGIVRHGSAFSTTKPAWIPFSSTLIEEPIITLKELNEGEGGVHG